MKALPMTEKPYELLEEKGEKALSDAQLLAILLKSGTKGERALDLSARLLRDGALLSDYPLQGLMKMSLTTLKSYRGIGRVKALEIKALLELSRRLSSAPSAARISMDKPEKVAAFYMDRFRLFTKEVAMAVFLNKKYERISELEVGRGALDFSFINQRDLFLSGYERGAYAFVLLHNHPSGDPSPSHQDIEMTQRLREAGLLLELRLADHIILGENAYYSFQEHQQLT